MTKQMWLNYFLPFSATPPYMLQKYVIIFTYRGEAHGNVPANRLHADPQDTGNFDTVISWN